MILDEIVAAKRVELRRLKEVRKPADVRAQARSAPPLRPFDLRNPDAVSIIAEIKRASPSKGVLNATLDPAVFAQAYASGGARAVSVLTEGTFFKGSPGDLRAARAASPLPVLRKDFIIDEYQIWETRAMPADAVLLIVRLLDRHQLQEYAAIAQEELHVPALVEIHNEKELGPALDARPAMIGINNRDLDTFEVALETTARLRPAVPEDIVVVSESGISSREDIELLRHLRVDAALVGEELVKSEDPAGRLKEFLGAGHGATRHPRSR